MGVGVGARKSKARSCGADGGERGEGQDGQGLERLFTPNRFELGYSVV